MGLTAVVEIRGKSLLTSSLDYSTPEDNALLEAVQALAAGTGAGQVSVVWHDRRTLAGGASENLDLAGALTNAFGATVTFTKVRALIIKNLSTAQILTVGAAAANAWQGPFGATTHTLILKPSGAAAFLAPDDGYDVTAGAGDQLKIANASGVSADYGIWLVGI